MADSSEKRQRDQEAPDRIEEDRPRKRQDLGPSHYASNPPVANSTFDGLGIQNSGTGNTTVGKDLNIAGRDIINST